MIKYILSLILLAVLIIPTDLAVAQTNFEGKIKFKITHDDDIMFLDYFIKEQNLRMEMGENQEAVFIKTDGKSLVLMPEQKQYMDLDNSLFSKLPGMTGMNKGKEDEEEIKDVDFEKFRTGKTMTILEYECAQWIIKDEEEKDEVEAWVTDELGNFMLMSSPMGGGFSPGWSSNVKNNGFFPLLVISRDEDGEETSRFEATEVKEQSLNNDLFGPPSDFTEFQVPGMKGLFK